MHHKNIDRLWQCWLVKQAHGKVIDLAWAKANLGMPENWYQKEYTFVDENGAPVNMKIADVFDPNKIQVNYDNLNKCEEAPRVTPQVAKRFLQRHKPTPPLKSNLSLISTQRINLSNSKVTVKLQPLPMQEMVPLGLDQGHPAQAYLTLKDVEIQGSPALTYKIYLVNKADPKKISYVATINMFGAGHSHEHHGHHGQLGSFDYQVSQNLSDIDVSDPRNANVIFEPTNLLLKNTIKQKPNNGLSVDSILLETRNTPPTP